MWYGISNLQSYKVERSFLYDLSVGFRQKEGERKDTSM